MSCVRTLPIVARINPRKKIFKREAKALPFQTFKKIICYLCVVLVLIMQVRMPFSPGSCLKNQSEQAQIGATDSALIIIGIQMKIHY